MAGQTEFLQAIQELERLGETNGNQLSMEEINSYFSDMKLEEKQLDFICNYFESHHIYITNRVQRFEEEIGDEEIPNKEDPMDAEIVAFYLKEMEKAAVLAKNEQLRADLLRSISHDLRTPLCAISGNADTLLHNEEGIDDATRKQIYTDIYDDAEWLVGVVENLLSVTRLNDNRLKLNMTDQLVDEVVDEAVRHVSRLGREHVISTDCEELLLARMDARLIIQVLVNLIENAVKYTQQGSEIQISAHRQGDKVCVRVADNGGGIRDDMKPHVFEMFYVGKTTVADSRRSLGLGLALSRSIVETHGGELTLSDNQPHGCIFSFTLPVSEVTLNE